jgi:hypothetical protein
MRAANSAWNLLHRREHFKFVEVNPNGTICYEWNTENGVVGAGLAAEFSSLSDAEKEQRNAQVAEGVVSANGMSRFKGGCDRKGGEDMTKEVNAALDDLKRIQRAMQ